MIKKIITICALLIHTLPGYAKQGKVIGKVTDDHGKPVAFCEIKAANSGRATQCNAHGEFSLVYNTDSSHTVTVSCMGYETQEVNIGDDALWVVLKHKLNKLEDVAVTTGHDGGEIKQAVLGKRSLQPHGICADVIGSEMAIMFNADPERHGVLQEVFFYITKEGIPNSKFRVHVYDIDKSFMPGAELLDSTVIIHANTGNEWASADVSSRHILIGRGVFIAVEWLSGSGNNPNIVRSDNGKGDWKFNTMVLAMTKGYHGRGMVNYQRSNIYHEWHHTDQNPYTHEKYLNPMIYATYTYHKK